MKRLVFLFLALFLSTYSLFSATEIGAGDVAGTWTAASSPYNINGDITVPFGSTLTIEPGVEVNFKGHHLFNIQGAMQAVGTAVDSIKFTATNTTEGWNGLRFVHQDGAGTVVKSNLDYAIVEYGNANGTNWNAFGGGVFINPDSEVDIDHAHFRNNKAKYKGGAIYNSSTSALSIINSVFENNEATGSGTLGGEGGAIYYGLDAKITLNSNKILNNTATVGTSQTSKGGGVYIYQADGTTTPYLSNNLIAGNAAGDGGGLFIYNSASQIYNLTIADNSASVQGGGISVFNSSDYFENCIVWNNTGTANAGIYENSGSSIQLRYSNVQGTYAGQGNISVDPKFAGTGNDPYTLDSQSPSVNTGNRAWGSVARIVGTQDLGGAGVAWVAASDVFTITMNSVTYTVSPADNGGYATGVAAAAAINTAFAAVTGGTLTDITDIVEAYPVFNNVGTVHMVGIRSKGYGAGQSFTLADGANTPLADLGIAAATYTGDYKKAASHVGTNVISGIAIAAGDDFLVDGLAMGNNATIDMPSGTTYNSVSSLITDILTGMTTGATADLVTGDVVPYNAGNNLIGLRPVLGGNGAALDLTLTDGTNTPLAALGMTAATYANAADSTLTSIDVLGNARIYAGYSLTADGAVDMGAYELQADKPLAQPVITAVANQSVNENSLLTVSFVATRPNGNNVLFSISSTTIGDMAFGNYDQTVSSGTQVTADFTWTPDYTQAGSQTVTILATDQGTGNIASESIQFNITISDVDQNVTVTDMQPSTGNTNSATPTVVTTGQNETVNFSFTGTDPDGNALVYSWKKDAVEVSTASTYDFTEGTIGSYTVELNVTDNFGSKWTEDYYWRVDVIPAGWSPNDTGRNMTLIFDPLELSTTTGVTIATGDYIAAFYDDMGVKKCAGIKAIATPANEHSITIWGDDVGETEKLGLDNGETPTFKYWDASTNIFYEMTINAFQGVGGAYTQNTAVYVDDAVFGTDTADDDNLDFAEIVNHAISLTTGWDIISSYVTPDEPLMSLIFSALTSDVIIVKDETGDIYSPIYDINQIGNWTVTEGYKIKMASAQTLTVTGTKVDRTTQNIDYDDGTLLWSIISYLNDAQADAINAGAGTFDNDANFQAGQTAADWEIIKDGDGNVIVQDGTSSIDEIVTLNPGEGYQVKIAAGTGAQNFQYDNVPVPAKNKLMAIVEEEVKAAKRTSAPTAKRTPKSYHYGNPIVTDKNASIIIPEAAFNEKIEEDDEIGAFDSEGNLVGVYTYAGGNFAMTIWGDDSTTDEKDGLNEGEAYTLKSFRSDGTERIFDDIDYLNGSQIYKTDNIEIVNKIEKVTVGIEGNLPKSTRLHQNYPNPFNPTTTINFDLAKDGHVELAVYNYNGQLVKNLVRSHKNAGRMSIKWNGRNEAGQTVSAGMYFYRMKANGYVKTMKAVMVK